MSAGILACGLLGGCGNDTTETTAPSADVTTADVETADTATETNPAETTTEYETETDVALNVTPVSIVYEAEGATEREVADVYVEPIEGISDDFMYGVDISTLLTQEAAGVTYYDLDGNEADLFKILADGGVNYIRVRVWNDPYDADGHGYGGGNCDVATAAEIGRRAAEYGMKLCVDFHYSDFWADPNKQMVPKAWDGIGIDNMELALYQFTRNSLVTIINAGAEVGMVQIGNEINYGMSGYTDWTYMCRLLCKGSEAVRAVSELTGEDILIAVHLTEVAKENSITGVCKILEDGGVDYDVMALSYYMFWHGTLKNLSEVMNAVVNDYGKKVVIAETSYIYTADDGDGTGNSVDAGELAEGYTASVQSQVNAVRDVCEAVSALGEDGLGVFYWEPAWTPVNHYDWEASNAEEVLAANEYAWNELGAGWATSYAGSYDAKDAGQYYGGSAWDNQAWFDFDSHALPSVNTYRYLKYGTTCDLKVDFVDDIELELNVGSELTLPETVYVNYNDRSKNDYAPVTWDADAVAAIDMSVDGDYEITGTLEDGTQITLYLSVLYINYVVNPSFEEEDRSMWVITYEGDKNPSDFQKKSGDAKTGDYSLHFWDSNDFAFTCEQTLTGLTNGTYYFSANAQGGDISDVSVMYIYVKDSAGNEIGKQLFKVDGWVNWQVPEIDGIEVTDGTLTIGVSVKSNSGSWGTLDDFYLCLKP